MKNRIAALLILLSMVSILLYQDIDKVAFGAKAEDELRDNCKGDVHLLFGLWVCLNE